MINFQTYFKIMAHSIDVHDIEEFEKLATSKDLEMAKAIVNTILENLTTKKRHIHVLEVYIKSTYSVFDLTVDRNNFVDTLEKNLKIFEHHEMYEDCAKVVEAIDYLKANIGDNSLN